MTEAMPDLSLDAIYGDSLRLDTFAQIEKAVREALPNAPRLLQILIAGSVFMSVEDDHIYLDQAYLICEQEIAKRYRGNDKTEDHVELTDEAEFLCSLHWYILFLYEHQPAFIKNDIFGSKMLDELDETELAEFIAGEPIAEPMRADDAHPKRPYSSSDIIGTNRKGIESHDEFWQTAQIEGFEQFLPQIQALIASNDFTIITGPRGSGKTYSLIPQLAEQNRPSITFGKTGLSLADITGLIEKRGKTHLTIILDEPKPFIGHELGALSVLKTEGYNFKIVIIMGGQATANSRIETANSAYSESLQLSGFSTAAAEVDFETHINKDYALGWLKSKGADQNLCDFLSDNPYLLSPRVFSTVFFGTLNLPIDYEDDTGVDTISHPLVREYMLGYSVDLKTENKPPRISFPPMTKAELVSILSSSCLTGIADRRHTQPRVIEYVAISTGQFTSGKYDEYKQLCESVGIAPFSENDLIHFNEIYT